MYKAQHLACTGHRGQVQTDTCQDAHTPHEYALAIKFGRLEGYLGGLYAPPVSGSPPTRGSVPLQAGKPSS